MTDWAKEYLDFHDGVTRSAEGAVVEIELNRRDPFTRSGVTVWPLAKIVRPEAIRWGSPVIVDDFVFIDGGAGTRIGDYVHVAVGAVICGGGELEVGDFSNLASGARIYTGTDDVLGGLVGPTVPAEFRSVTRAKTTIGRHVHVLANAVVHAGATIPDGCVIAPGCVVRESDRLEPWGVYGGAPARLIGERATLLRRSVLAREAALRESFPR